MTFFDELSKLGKKKRPHVDQDHIEEGELKEAGVEIQAHDPRLPGGISQSNLTKAERARLRKLRGG